jgi:hypothetical protein
MAAEIISTVERCAADLLSELLTWNWTPPATQSVAARAGVRQAK